MFNFLSCKLSMNSTHLLKPIKSSSWIVATILGASLLMGCQPTTNDNATKVEDSVTLDETKAAVQSESAATHIENLQPVYVEQMQSLQRRLQAEYESLQAADITISEEVEKKPKGSNDSISTDTQGEDKADVALSTEGSRVNASADVNANSEISVETDDANSKPELTVLRSVSAEPREPIILTDAQIVKSYQQVTKALYQPVSKPLNSEETDALINIASLIPQLFEHTELANRLDAKSPALARLIVQHQIWEQIETRQALYMQEMKVAQQKEFEGLMTKFNDTIKGYDEQIAKYEQTLKEFE